MHSASPPPLEAVVFDLDGTLVRPTIDFGLMRARVEAVLSAHGVDVAEVRGLRIWEMVEAAAARLDGSGPLARAVRAAAHGAILAVECEAAARSGPLPGVRRMLGRLRARGVAVGVVTRNSAAAARLAFPGIAEACGAFLPRDAVEHVKPHPVHLGRCLALLRAEPARALMVGDHPIDIESGRRHGMRTAGVLTGSGTREDLERAGADYILNDATAVPALLGAAGGRGSPTGRTRRPPPWRGRR
ncbi:MAG: HAD family hydrolase [bacterium]|nr:HAD family hydrolase [bacterium]